MTEFKDPSRVIGGKHTPVLFVTVGRPQSFPENMFCPLLTVCPVLLLGASIAPEGVANPNLIQTPASCQI